MGARAISAIRTLLGRAPREASLVVLATLIFFGVTVVWWLAADNQVPDFDMGNHLLDAFTVHAQLAAGEWTAPFTGFNNYPPLVHLVGGLGLFVGGFHTASVLVANNVVFLPLLVGGAYGAGTLAYGRRGGLLAALFVLGAPIVVSEMHEYYVDPGEAAMVSISVWAILASRRFERVGMSALAGLLCGLGMLTKQTFFFFVAGLVLMVVLRGGWRHWRGMLAFASVGGAFGLPWYIGHLTQNSALTSGATAVGSGSAPAQIANLGVTPLRYSNANYSWYFWNMLNHQLLAPLTVLVVIGVVLALWRYARRRDPADLGPELLAGALVGYAGVTYITLKDPRYSLPAIVYFAVLGTGWIATARPRVRRWLTAGVVAVVITNLIMVAGGVGGTVSFGLPGAPSTGISLVEARTVTLFSPAGWLRGGPVKDGDLIGLLRGLKRLGVASVEFDGGSTDSPDFNNAGLVALGMEAGLYIPPIDNLSTMGPLDAFVLRHAIVPGDPPPCQLLRDGTGVYVTLGNPLRHPFEEQTWTCPGRVPVNYRRTAPLPEIDTHNITGAPRAQILAVMRAMRRQGIRTIEFDAVSSYSTFTDPIGFERLAAIAGLRVQNPYELQTLGPKVAFMLRHVQAAGDPVPCETLPDGSGIYIVLGNPLKPFKDYRFYCPVSTPRFYSRTVR